jgi:hypothetical protein
MSTRVADVTALCPFAIAGTGKRSRWSHGDLSVCESKPVFGGGSVVCFKHSHHAGAIAGDLLKPACV